MREICRVEKEKIPVRAGQPGQPLHFVSLVESNFTILDPRLGVRDFKVLDFDGRDIGHVNTLWIDEGKREVRFLQVGQGGLWGWGENQFLIPTEAVTMLENGCVRIDQSGEQPFEESGNHFEYRPELVARSEAENDDTNSLSHWSTVYSYSGYPPLILDQGEKSGSTTIQGENIMKTAKSLIGLLVVGQSDGVQLGRIRDLIFDLGANRVLALILNDKELFGAINAHVVLWCEVRSVGTDVVLVKDKLSQIRLKDDITLRDLAETHRDTMLSGTSILTSDGQRLGTLADMMIDENSGEVTGYQVSGGFVADTLHGKKFLPASTEMNVGQDVAIVPPGTESILEPWRS